MANTTYNLDFVARAHGFLSDTRRRTVISKRAEAVTAFGIVVSRGTDPDVEAVLGGTVPVGITIVDQAQEANLAGAISYGDNDMMSVLASGAVNITCATSFVAEDAVTYDNTTGVIGNSAVAGNVVALTGARWETSGGAGAVGVISLSGQL